MLLIGIGLLTACEGGQRAAAPVATSSSAVPDSGHSVRCAPDNPGYCFPVADLAKVTDPLVADGFACRHLSITTLCLSQRNQVAVTLGGPPGRLLSIEFQPLSVALGKFDSMPDEVTALGEIQSGVRTVLPLAIPGGAAEQQRVEQWIDRTVRTPGTCPRGVHDGDGYALSCLGHPAPAPRTDGIAIALVQFDLLATDWSRSPSQ